MQSDDEFFDCRQEDAQDGVLGSSDLVSIAFKFLPPHDRARLARVCRAWQVASQSPGFWKHLDFGGKLTSPQIVSLCITFLVPISNSA
jgi:hypothetical protein